MSGSPKRRATLASVVIGLWLGGLAFLGKRELLRPHMDKLADAGLRVAPGASYFAVLQQGQQIGFASSTVDTTPTPQPSIISALTENPFQNR